jgi:ABC-type Fe3+-hydroxamate transport system substrate-binding protein
VSSGRVVSLVPSATETLAAWGVVPVAVTRFCERPDLPQVGGTKDPDTAAVVDARPDLVVMCVEENRLEDAEVLRAAGMSLFVFDIDTVDNVGPQLRALADRVGADVADDDVPPGPRPPAARAFVPIWRRPWMTLAGGTYGSSMLSRLGIENVFGDGDVRYPDVTLDQARSRRPDLVIAPSEPYPFAERHRAELESVAPVVLVDGKDLFWWGVRRPPRCHVCTTNWRAR